MARRKGIHPVVAVAGAMVIIILLVIFTPAILGATAADRDLEKYNGSSPQGNESVRIAGAVDTYLVGLTGMPLQVIAFFVAIFCVIVVLIWAFGGKRKH